MRPLLLSLLLACGPKAAPPRAAATPTPAALLALQAPADGAPIAVPAALAASIEATLQARNLPPKAIGAAQFGPALASRRLSPHRLAWLAANADGAPLIVLVEAEAERYSELSGRYRWLVSLTVSVAAADRPAEAITRQTRFPVFLEFHHEGADEALIAASPLITRELSRLLDDWIAGTAP